MFSSKNSTNTPYSTIFDDIYFNSEDGYSESKYVFLEGNKLPQKWAASPLEDQTITEIGFGTGLNFLSCMKLWGEFVKPQSKLRYISIEKYPLTAQEIDNYLLFPEILEQKQEFLAKYNRPHNSAPSEIKFSNNISLELYIGDIKNILVELGKNQHHTSKIDSWFLDGFSPNKNPDMWCEELFDFMQKNTNHNGTFSTFTSAGFVRRALLNRGFVVEKVKGFRNKREMLTGIYKTKAMK